MMFWMKIHEYENRKIIAVCDEHILGEVFEEEEYVLNVAEGFYKGDLKKLEEVINEIKKYDFESVNLAGNNIVSMLLKAGIISTWKEIKGIKYAHIYDVRE